MDYTGEAPKAAGWDRVAILPVLSVTMEFLSYMGTAYMGTVYIHRECPNARSRSRFVLPHTQLLIPNRIT